jgi:hypothetical protein
MSSLRLIIALPLAALALYVGSARTGESYVATAAKAPQAQSSTQSSTQLASKTSVTTKRAQRGWSYDWPVKPFDRPHPVRGYFDDPRVTPDFSGRGFHFGIDISLPFNTAVFAIQAGRVSFINKWAVAIRSGSRTLEYWHIVPVVRDGQWVSRHTLLGRTKGIFNHVHLSESLNRRYVNPLRSGGIGPFADHTAPDTDRLSFRRRGGAALSGSVHGRVDIVADSFDTVTDVKPRPWPVTPSLLRWRIFRGGRVVVAWQVAHDFRSRFLRPSEFDRIYARGTRMNHPGWPGHYCFYLAHGWRSGSLPNGEYRLQVAASDVRGNLGLSLFSFTIAN